MSGRARVAVVAGAVGHGRAAPAADDRGDQIAADIVPEPGRVIPDAPLFGRSWAANSLKRMHVGSATATPKVNTSRAPREGINEIRLAAASDTAERTNAWSHSFDNRITNSVEHWDRIVGSISAGRCVTKPRYTLYLRLPWRCARARDGWGRSDIAVGGCPAVRPPRRQTTAGNAVTPEAEVEGHAADHRHHRVHDLGRNSGEPHDGHRLAFEGNLNNSPSTSAMVSPPTLAFSNMKA